MGAPGQPAGDAAAAAAGAAAGRHPARGRRAGDPGRPDPAAARLLLDLCLAISITLVGPDPADRPVHRAAARVQRLPDRAADRHHAAAGAQPRLDPADPGPGPSGARRRRPRDRGVRPLHHAGQRRHRRDRVRHPGDRELRRHHQGLGPHRRGRRPLLARRDARQADGDRRRPVGRPDRRGDGARAPPRARGGERLLRRHGRCRQVRARRRHRRPADHRDQPGRRPADRRGADGRRPSARPRTPTRCSPSATGWSRRSRPDHLDRGRPPGVQGRRRRPRRRRRVRPAGRLPARPGRDRRPAGAAGDPARPAGPAVPAARPPAPAASPGTAHARSAAEPGGADAPEAAGRRRTSR